MRCALASSDMTPTKAISCITTATSVFFRTYRIGRGTENGCTLTLTVRRNAGPPSRPEHNVWTLNNRVRPGAGSRMPAQDDPARLAVPAAKASKEAWRMHRAFRSTKTERQEDAGLAGARSEQT